MIGIDPRHSLHHLSLLPSGPDEVRDRLLRGGRSKWPADPVFGPARGNSAPHQADFGYRAPLAPRLAQPCFNIKDPMVFSSKKSERRSIFVIGGLTWQKSAPYI